MKRIINSPTDSIATYYVRDAQGNVLSVYTLQNGVYTWSEQHLYGSSRLGMVSPRVTWNGVGVVTSNPYQSTSSKLWLEGHKRYEISNHLGNVMATINDRKAYIVSPLGTMGTYTASVLNATDYYAFGLEMPGRSYTSGVGGYRYGFNGKENDKSFSATSTFLDFDARIYNPALGRWLSLDPLAAKMPAWSPYSNDFNNPIRFVDADGKKPNDNILYVLVLAGANKKVAAEAIKIAQENIKTAGLQTKVVRVTDPSKFDISKIDNTDAVSVIGGSKQEAAKFTLNNLDKGYLSKVLKNHISEGIGWLSETHATNPETSDKGDDDWGYVTLTSTLMSDNIDFWNDKNTCLKHFGVKKASDMVGLNIVHGMGHLAGIEHPYGGFGFMGDGPDLKDNIKEAKGSVKQTIENTNTKYPEMQKIMKHRFQNPPKLNYDPNKED